MNTSEVFSELNAELEKRGIHREIKICGGAALISLKVVTRGTKDVDVLKPKIDHDLNDAALSVAKKLNLNINWLNNGPSMLVHELPPDWEQQCTKIFSGTHLTVHSIGRRDLIYSKLYAAADRIDDINDLLALKPSNSELEEARNLVLRQDASELWPQIVDECVNELKRRLKDGR